MHKKTRQFSMAIALVAALGAHCPRTAAVESTAEEPSSSGLGGLIRVPLCRQATDYTCGVSALQSVLGYYGEQIREDVLSKALKATTKDGTSYHQIARFARKRGYAVEVKTGLTLSELEGLLDRKQPVICLIQAWSDKRVDYSSDWDDGHYVVAVGYDRQFVYFMDPSTLGNYTRIAVGDFLKRWHDTDGKERLVHFGIVISGKHQRYDPNAVKPIL